MKNCARPSAASSRACSRSCSAHWTSASAPAATRTRRTRTERRSAAVLDRVFRREHLVEAVSARLASGQPDRRGQRTAREDVAVGGAMGELDTLAFAGEENGVFAGHVAGAQ